MADTLSAKRSQVSAAKELKSSFAPLPDRNFSTLFELRTR